MLTARCYVPWIFPSGTFQAVVRAVYPGYRPLHGPERESAPPRRRCDVEHFPTVVVMRCFYYTRHGQARSRPRVFACSNQVKPHHQDEGFLRTWGGWQQMQHATLALQRHNNADTLTGFLFPVCTWVQQGTFACPASAGPFSTLAPQMGECQETKTCLR